MAPRRTDPTPPNTVGKEGDVAYTPDGVRWVWHGGTIAEGSGLPVIGGGGAWKQEGAPIPQPSTTTGTTSPGGVPTGRAADPPAAAAPTAGQTGTADPGGAQQYDQPPTGVDDNALATWLQQHAIGMDTEIARLSTAEDAAALALQTALATSDPEAIHGATAGVQAANQRLKVAQTTQATYLAQLQPVQARLDKVDARNDPQAKEERQQRMLALQSQIDANAAQQRLADARLKKEMNPWDAKAARDLTIAQGDAAKANAAYDRARADAYPDESKAAVKASDASTALSTAQTKQIDALVAAGMPKAQATALIASGNADQAQADQIQALIAAGMPEAQARAMVAQGEASRAATKVSELDLHQKQIGELGTYAEQLQKQVDAGVLTRDQARSMLQAKSDELATGATAYTRQSQTAANSLAFAQEAQRQGTLVNMGQQYATGAEPGGAYSQMSEALGFGPVSQPLHPTPLPQAIRALGADVNTPYTTAQLGMPAPNLPGPAPTSADSFTYSPAVQAPPPAMQGLGTAQVDWTALTGPQVLALARGGAPPLPETPPTARVPVTQGRA